MDKSFIDMYCSYSVLNNITNKRTLLSEFQIRTLEKNLKIFINSSGTDDNGEIDGSSNEQLVFEDVKDFDDEIINILTYNLKNCKNDTQKHKLKNLINLLKKHLQKALDESKKNKQEIHKEHQDNLQEITNNLAEYDLNDDIQNKFIEYGLFGLNKALNPNYFPTQVPHVNTSNLDGLSREQLVNMFTPENFYKLTKPEIMALLQATANEYLSSNGVTPCAVQAEDFELSPNRTLYGCYSPNKGTISLNKNIIGMVDSLRNVKDPYLPYQLLSTLIHEAKHRRDFSMLDSNFLSEKDKIICDALRKPNSTTYSEYLSAADELSARNESLEYFRTIAQTTGNENLKAFYNYQKNLEMRNPKRRVSKSVEDCFPDIYDGRLLETTIKPINKIQFNKIVRDLSTNEMNL